MSAGYSSKWDRHVTPPSATVSEGAAEKLHAELVQVTIRIALLNQTEAFSMPLGYAVVAIAALRADPSRKRWEAAGRHVRGLVDQVTREEHQQAGTCLCLKWDSETEKKALQIDPCFRCGMALR